MWCNICTYWQHSIMQCPFRCPWAISRIEPWSGSHVMIWSGQDILISSRWTVGHWGILITRNWAAKSEAATPTVWVWLVLCNLSWQIKQLSIFTAALNGSDSITLDTMRHYGTGVVQTLFRQLLLYNVNLILVLLHYLTAGGSIRQNRLSRHWTFGLNNVTRAQFYLANVPLLSLPIKSKCSCVYDYRLLSCLYPISLYKRRILTNILIRYV